MRFHSSPQALWPLPLRAGPRTGLGSQPSLPSLPFLPSQVHHILQEVVIGGMVLETNMNEIVAQVEAQSKLEKAEVSGRAAALPRARLVYSRLRGGTACGVWS